MRQLRNQGAEVVDRVLGGQSLTVTRGGHPVAELRPLPQAGLRAEALLSRWRHLPHVDPASFREDIDEILDPTL